MKKVKKVVQLPIQVIESESVNELVVSFIQETENQTELITSIKGDIKENEVSKLIGTALNYLHAYLKVRKAVKSKGLKLSQPIQLRLQLNGLVINTCNANVEFKERMKVNSSSKSMRLFADKVNEVVNFMLMNFEVKTVEQFKNELPIEPVKIEVNEPTLN